MKGSWGALDLFLVTDIGNAYQKVTVYPLWNKALLGISFPSLHDFLLINSMGDGSRVCWQKALVP